jgi:hypothetical protein
MSSSQCQKLVQTNQNSAYYDWNNTEVLDNNKKLCFLNQFFYIAINDFFKWF